MVRVRANHARSDEAREELVGVGERIETLRLVHEQLYEAGAAGALPMRPFLSQLVGNLCRLHEAEAGGIELECDIANVDLGPEAAVPIGLIANEFVTNSLKHAFGDDGGTISVSLEETGIACVSASATTARAYPPILTPLREARAPGSGSVRVWPASLGQS